MQREKKDTKYERKRAKCEIIHFRQREKEKTENVKRQQRNAL